MNRPITTIDFETHPIEDRPKYPPEPVGLAVKYPSGESKYMAWGHTEGNNCSKDGVGEYLRSIFRDPNMDILCHNAKFDLEVAYAHFDCPHLPWHRIHDTMFSHFLMDPHARSSSLKPVSEELLGWAPEEQDAVADYVWENRRELTALTGRRVNGRNGTSTNAWAFYASVPAGVLEPYAVGDVDRTRALHDHLYPLVKQNGMGSAYDRERRALPIFMDNERRGLRVDSEQLAQDIDMYRASLKEADLTLAYWLGDDDLNIDADHDVAEAFARNGVILDGDWVLTEKSGQRSVSKDNLPPSKFQDPDVAHMWFYRNRLKTFLSTFIEPWHEMGQATGGFIYPQWNQTRNPEGGTRTGRPSCNKPNILNIPKRFDAAFDMAEGNEFGLAPLPRVRKYVLPDEGEVFGHRDYSQQELRIFAHYESGELLDQYQSAPDLDLHDVVGRKMAEAMGQEYDKAKHRAAAKVMNFGRLYGKGRPAVSKDLDCSLEEAGVFIGYHDQALPGMKALADEIEEVTGGGDPVRTLGGRGYYPEPPKRVGGKLRSFEYKLTNYLIQGSAADMTKEAMVLYESHPERRGRFLCQVYDEMNFSVAERWLGHEMEVMDECMLQAAENLGVDCPMMTDGKAGPNWGALKEME